MSAPLGILGGSGLYALDELSDVEELDLDTPFGAPSAPLVLGTWNGVRVAFLARHGRGHVLLPGEVPYRANLWALRSLGVERVVSVSAVGSLREECAPGDFVLPDQFVDRTRGGRARTFFGDGVVAHVPMADPVDAVTVAALAAAAEGLDVRVHVGGTYVCIEGPQFSTRAESEFHRAQGFALVGMTNATEALLAREAGLAYASVCMVTDWDCWRSHDDDVDVEAVLAVMRRNLAHARDLLARALPALAALGPSPWRGIARAGLLTDPARVPDEAWRRLEPLLGPKP